MTILRTTRVLVALITFAGSVSAGVPLMVHIGQVLDAETNAPLADVHVIAVLEGWPKDAKKPGIVTTQTDSAGVYHLAFSRPAEVLFVRAGYDSVRLYWPIEFEKIEQAGCGINLKPVRLVGIKK